MNLSLQPYKDKKHDSDGRYQNPGRKTLLNELQALQYFGAGASRASTNSRFA